MRRSSKGEAAARLPKALGNAVHSRRSEGIRKPASSIQRQAGFLNGAVRFPVAPFLCLLYVIAWDSLKFCSLHRSSADILLPRFRKAHYKIGLYRHSS